MQILNCGTSGELVDHFYWHLNKKNQSRRFCSTSLSSLGRIEIGWEDQKEPQGREDIQSNDKGRKWVRGKKTKLSTFSWLITDLLFVNPIRNSIENDSGYSVVGKAQRGGRRWFHVVNVVVVDERQRVAHGTPRRVQQRRRSYEKRKSNVLFSAYYLRGNKCIDKHRWLIQKSNSITNFINSILLLKISHTMCNCKGGRENDRERNKAGYPT